MSEEWPKITSRKIIKISQWMDVMAREVEFSKGDAPQTYYAVSQLDYLAILAVTPDGRIPIVHQYRPALETFTWELPAGLLEKGEAQTFEKKKRRIRTFCQSPNGRGSTRAITLISSINVIIKESDARRQLKTRT